MAVCWSRSRSAEGHRLRLRAGLCCLLESGSSRRRRQQRMHSIQPILSSIQPILKQRMQSVQQVLRRLVGCRAPHGFHLWSGQGTVLSNKFCRPATPEQQATFDAKCSASLEQTGPLLGTEWLLAADQYTTRDNREKQDVCF